jgi:hypothetical protein
MTHQQLGHAEQARDTLARLRAAAPADAGTLLHEAAALIDGETAQSRP